MTVIDQVNRKIQRTSDGLGRLVTVNEQDATGALTQATNYSYDYLDKLIGVNQGGQLRSYKYARSAGCCTSGFPNSLLR